MYVKLYCNLAGAGTELGRGRLGILTGGTTPGSNVDEVKLAFNAVGDVTQGNLPGPVWC